MKGNVEAPKASSTNKTSDNSFNKIKYLTARENWQAYNKTSTLLYIKFITKSDYRIYKH